MIRRRIAGAVLAMTIVGIAGCAGHTDEEPELGEEVPCPPARLLADTAHLTQFADAQPNSVNPAIRYEADLVSVSSSCKRMRDLWSIDLQVKAVAGRVGAPPDEPVVFPVFVALTEYDRKVIEKRVVGLPALLDRTPRASVQIPVEGLSAPRYVLRAGPGYEILVGFQLTPEQLAWNRRRQMD